MATGEDAAAGLDVLLTSLATFVRRFVVVNEDQSVAVALWIAHTHAIDAFDCTPYLQITSATKRAGKTRLLEVLEPVVPRAWFTGRTSAAALVRKVDAECPTLLLDESDAAFGGEKEYAEALRGILNSGYRRSGKATVCVGQGAKIEARDFRTFGPKAIAGIGKLPDTVADRSIPIQLRRRTADEPCDRWRDRDGHAEAAPLHARLAAWAEKAIEILRDARPALPPSLGDRQADVWEPLLSIADLAGGCWPADARSAAIGLAGGVEDTDIRIELLQDVKAILEDFDGAIIPTKELLDKLAAQEDRPWATWSSGKAITAHKLAKLLRPLAIQVAHLRGGNGYRADAFVEAFARYLPPKGSQLHRVNENGPDSSFSSLHSASRCEGSKMPKTAMNIGVGEDVKLQTRDGEGDDAGRF